MTVAIRVFHFVRHRDAGPEGECLSHSNHHAAHGRIIEEIMPKQPLPSTGWPPKVQAQIDAAFRKPTHKVATSPRATIPPMVLFFVITEPPSVNTWKNFHRTGGKYFAWKQSALMEVRAQLRNELNTPIDGPLFLQMIFAKGRADLDNRIKPILDLLQAAAIIENDRQVELLTAGFGAEKGTCTVAISQLTAAAVR